MKKYALCVGINAYPGGNALQGCVNDARGWEGILLAAGYDVTRVLDGQATKATVVSYLRDAMAKMRWGDRFVFTYSGHGTWLPDTDRDEIDARDEALCMVDFQSGGLIVDDELRAIFGNRVWGTRVSVFSDSCFSGTVARGLSAYDLMTKRPRFINPMSFLVPDKARVQAHHILMADERPNPKHREAAYSALFSGCREDQVSYDAHINGVWQGAFSDAAFKSYRTGISYRDWYADIRRMLPSAEYDQEPQLQATPWQKGWKL